ncbi:DNA adenine methylase [Candidatus Sulfidibacterium hydrothermale]|uniref:DNA adenine methylase n=1 Tax=Candidatus Sulfidibacterium hydrothermale TaxID=2875962 RepID=UPI001F0A161D|nr:DNA adenine methylase [Candidatus Sulfidibacterium hydrothermale]UBM61379.1 DNA adenine methylase [Candidatus Sulfidibacterium hydrothermale]
MKVYEISNRKSSSMNDLFYEYKLGAKPFLKWVGGKRQLLEQFEELYPIELKLKKIKNYYEPFVGGGAVFFDVAQNYEIENAFLYDINDELIISYKVIQKDVNKLIEFLYRYDKQYKKLNDEKRKEYYYELRENYNLQRFNIDYNKYSENWIPRVAQTIFLNKTCFNGLFRFNSKGGFNSPMGRYKNPKILDEQNLLNVSKLLEIATIKKADFREVKNDVKNNSFIYFDPPYRPISKTASFTSYSKYNFQDDEQLQLASLFYELDQQGHKLMLSNSDPKNINPEDDFFETIYSAYNITRVNAKRSINSNGSKRNSIKEIVVTNY